MALAFKSRFFFFLPLLLAYDTSAVEIVVVAVFVGFRLLLPHIGLSLTKFGNGSNAASAMAAAAGACLKLMPVGS